MRRFAITIVAVCMLFGASARAGTDDELETYRRKFQDGYEKYQAGNFAEAIVAWEPIYQQLGPKRGYRLAFNLARAYDAHGDFKSAAEKYEVYVNEVAARRAANENLESNVEKQEAEAKARLQELSLTHARIKVTTRDQPIAVKIDEESETHFSGYTAWVTPGRHTITFNPELKSGATVVIVDAKEGELAEVTAPEIPNPPQTPKSNPDIKPPPPLFTKSLEHPFSPWVLYVSGAATVVSFALPAALYANATSSFNQFKNDGSKNSTEQSNYNNARSAAYDSWILPGALGAITASLTAYYFFGKREVLVPVAPQVGLSANAATLGLSGIF